MMQPTLALRDVCKDYPKGDGSEQRVLHNLQLSVNSGEMVGLLGPNGSGKSTALKIAAGLVTPSAGTGDIGEDAIGSRMAQRRTGYLPERGGLAEHLTGAEALTWWAAMNGRPQRDAADLARCWLGKVNLRGAADQYVANMSKGTRQRLGIAQALMLEPDLVLLDEPFSGLDPLGVDLSVALLREQVAQGAAVLLTSHLMHRVEELCDSVVLLAAGAVLAQGKVGQLLGRMPPRQRGLDDVFRELLTKEGEP
jgi:ABC-2 type transport system ATP-binding protein